jgi:hypothetical protein
MQNTRPVIVVTVEGGVVQNVSIPEGCQVTVRVIDYDNGDADDIDCDRDDAGELCSIVDYEALQ